MKLPGSSRSTTVDTGAVILRIGVQCTGDILGTPRTIIYCSHNGSPQKFSTILWSYPRASIVLISSSSVYVTRRLEVVMEWSPDVVRGSLPCVCGLVAFRVQGLAGLRVQGLGFRV